VQAHKEGGVVSIHSSADQLITAGAGLSVCLSPPCHLPSILASSMPWWGSWPENFTGHFCREICTSRPMWCICYIFACIFCV